MPAGFARPLPILYCSAAMSPAPDRSTTSIPPSETRSSSPLRRLRPVAIAILLLGASAWFLHNQFPEISFTAVHAAIGAQPMWAIWTTVACTTISFAGLASYDALAAWLVARGRVSLWLSAFAGATSNAVSNTLGFHLVTGGAVRLRLYRTAGLSIADIAGITSLAAASVGLGFAAMLAVALLIEPPGTSPLPWLDPRLAGGIILLLLGLLLLWLAAGKRSVTIGSFYADLPSGRLAAAQMVLGAAEMCAVITGLYILLPADLVPPFGMFAAVFIIAVVLGIGSNLPGGIGVFEATIIAIIGGAGRSDVLAALLLYRLLYNILPFVLAVLALSWFEWSSRSRAKAGA
jgi:uncharacterized membrane protein YbhN (UPF0104 family)